MKQLTLAELYEKECDFIDDAAEVFDKITKVSDKQLSPQRKQVMLETVVHAVTMVKIEMAKLRGKSQAN